MRTGKRTFKRIKIGIVANEFFAEGVGGIGGFGWAARQVANFFHQHPEHGIDAVFLNRTLPLNEGAVESWVHDTRLISRGVTWRSDLRRLRAERFDLLLMIDYRPSYRFFAGALPRTPIIVWVRDPRPPADVRKINTLRIPGAGPARPQGIDEINCTSLGVIVRASRLLARPVLFATLATDLADKVHDTYRTTPSQIFHLPNPIDINPAGETKSERLRVIFLGRLDPIKRPWLFAELARQFPEVEFLFLGNNHFEGEGAWQPTHLPANVQMLGHVDGAEKLRLLASAWALVNTSIHEGVAVSMLESLACATPVISCQNPAELVSRFGIYTGRFDGTGLEGMPKFVEGLRRLLGDRELRLRLGREGRRWVGETHNSSQFIAAFDELCARAEVRRPVGSAEGRAEG
ncbi:MAG TPA: glycosyltransferase [Pyrinomonadaceae bacterium]|nr:glycosyltransferase [Pyrinomonadaceae bacterium]